VAVYTKVAGDAQLKTLLPDGVYWDVSASGKTRVVILKLMNHEATDMFGHCAFEQPIYLVKAVEFSTSKLNVLNAAKRIDALLNNQPLTITGYTLMTTQLMECVEYNEPDTANPDGRWQHCGAMYRVTVSPN